jgi:BirA family transcriptional regulator, biotin operon repressor / biotin---[acetyl-CoA-carboxylase] ligase
MPQSTLPSWPTAALSQELAALLPGLALEVAAALPSTNSALLDHARLAPDAGPRLLVAEQQTQGRGRQGKPWQSQAGASLTFSLGLALAPVDWAGLSLAVGLALAEALDPLGPGRAPRLGIKWPNDLLLRNGDGGEGGATPGRKLGGILIETVQSGAGRYAVVGVGLNLQPLADAGGPLAWGQASLSEWLPGITAAQALARVAPPLLRALLAFEQRGFAPLQAAFAARDVLAGRAVATTWAGAPQGVADGVDASGALWLRGPTGERLRLSSGEVSLRPLPEAAC